ncbi:hypothetical protein RchiOBHm_Chr6g0290551 [Rosa chinensis]|uniref:Uncharacterized protein n=1 Tax=Rosa chinensis TaxID=74649 RepID=A0A2P6PVY0_ROSCH|nr:hypothetical protein RchiOBHm_Chr6g0290551 [Rosa chinensis]
MCFTEMGDEVLLYLSKRDGDGGLRFFWVFRFDWRRVRIWQEIWVVGAGFSVLREGEGKKLV